ncbi:hypothetical protein ABZ805_09635 [Saccharopolyspora sp. NPDC047091]|uniref:hypothetical protein n=1 Tax=Saccharopolyspora sp. NPDC047091 TaxID=3155924 RepID=UPI0033C5F377
MGTRSSKVAGHGRARRNAQLRQPPRGRWRSAAVAIGLALATAAAGLVVPKAWTAISDRLHPPVVVSVASQELSDDHSYVLPYVPGGAEAAAIAEPANLFGGDSPTLRRATKAGTSTTRIVVQGKSSHTVVITDMRARVLRREPAPTGTYFFAPAQGDLSTIVVGVDLDEVNPVARSLVAGRRTDPYFRDNAVTLAAGEPAVFLVESHAAEPTAYEWALEIDLVVDGKAETRTVQRADGPFRLSGLGGHYSAVYEWAGDRWNHPDPVAYCGAGKCG